MNLDGIPAELIGRPQWVIWQRTTSGAGKPKKVPYVAGELGRKASSTNASTWRDFATAVKVLDDGQCDGIGYAITADDALVLVDLDDVQNGNGPHSAAWAIVAALDTFSETSQSGEGLHCLLHGRLPADRRRQTKGPWGGELATFDHDRFVYVTGDRIDGTPGTIEARQIELERVLDEFMPAPVVAAVLPTVPVNLDDEELIAKARGAKNGERFDKLWAGGWQGIHQSQSEADLELCGMFAFWTGRDQERIDRMFRASGLMRPKWDRGKPSYGQRTIQQAVVTTDRVYEPRPAAVKAAPAAEPDDKTLRARPLVEVEMRSIEWLERPLWQRSAFQLLAGAKGSGKGTYLAGLAARITQAGENVLFVSTEDSTSIDLKPRLVAAGADITRCFDIPMHVQLPDHIDALRKIAEGIGGLGMFVIDPVANHIGDRDSNSDGPVRDAIAPLNALADNLACLLIGVRHPGKSRERGALASILGSTAWVDTPRAVVMIAVDDEDPIVRHIQVVAGNRSANGAAEHFRIDTVKVPTLTEPITVAVPLGTSDKNVDDLLAISTKTSKSQDARELILALLEDEGPQESDALDARIARETGLTPKTVRNNRTMLTNEGLIRPVAVRGEVGGVDRWTVVRTLAPRP